MEVLPRPRRAEVERGVEQRAHDQRHPEGRAGVLRAQLRALHERLAEAEVLEDAREPGDDPGHADDAEVGGHQQPGEDDADDDLDALAGELAERAPADGGAGPGADVISVGCERLFSHRVRTFPLGLQRFLQ